jgi:serine/threonine protein kinase
MPFLTEQQLALLSSHLQPSTKFLISRGASRTEYQLCELRGHGMKGVVWRGTDDLGNAVAIKFIPAAEYLTRSLIDEMSEASRLSGDLFAELRFFGDAQLGDLGIHESYKCIVTEWIDGKSLSTFLLEDQGFSVFEFMLLAEQLCSILAALQNARLCHDDLHAGNILLEHRLAPLTMDTVIHAKVIDSGSIKRPETRLRLLGELRAKLSTLRECRADVTLIKKLEEFLAWKEPDDHLRIVECLLLAANAVSSKYARLDFWERKFVDELPKFFDTVTDPDLGRRLDSPRRMVEELRALAAACKRADAESELILSSPFDYISAEMIRNDREFSELFSLECPWLDECSTLQPLYIYGPRGCGKSSVLRWLSLKTVLSDPGRARLDTLREIGIYISCSVELRSRFWLMTEGNILAFEAEIIGFFTLLLLEALFDTLDLLAEHEAAGACDLGFSAADQHSFATWVIKRLTGHLVNPITSVRFQGQGLFSYLKDFVRRIRWDMWSFIQRGALGHSGLPDPSLVFDICRSLQEYFPYFVDRHITFLVDDYSNQRIPVSLQRRLNQTISFAKQGTPIFKVSSEYQGVDLEGIQEGREVVEVNVGARYISLDKPTGSRFIADIVNIRLRKAQYSGNIEGLLGQSNYSGATMPTALAEETPESPFYYHGLDTVHWLCSGDVALALDLISALFERGRVERTTTTAIPAHRQHEAIQQFSHEEVRRIKYIVPFGEAMYDIVCYLGLLARAFVVAKRSNRSDRQSQPMCKTHLDIRSVVVRELEDERSHLAEIYRLLTSRAILFSLETSRSRISGALERLQMKRIFFPAFKAPTKRDVAIKLDTVDDLKSLLNNPKTFSERELGKSRIPASQLEIAMECALAKPRD